MTGEDAHVPQGAREPQGADAHGGQAAGRPRVGFHVSAFGSSQILAALSSLSRCGFEGLEIYADTSHIFAADPGEFRAILEITGIALAGVHGGGMLTSAEFREGEMAEWRRLVKWTADVGGSYAIFYGGEDCGTPSQNLDRAASFLNELGRYATECGVRLCYEPDRSCPFATKERIAELMAATEPQFVRLSVDTAHLTRMGFDPALFVITQKHRLGVVHFRDIPAADAGRAVSASQTGDGPSSDIGTGVVDFEAVVEALRMVGYQDWIVGVVERPKTDAAASADHSAQYLRDFLGLSF